VSERNEHHDTPVDGRTGLVELTSEECWALLDATSHGRVAVSVGTTPDIFPVSYCVKDGEIAIRTEAGTKLAAGTMMPAIAFEIDEFDLVGRKGWSVVVKGRGREPGTLDEVVALDALDMEPWVDAAKTRWLVITPYSVTGRRVP
jgi:nitroimidazol reductase NimA-like FMN-containing flavoprotein (pyridoxamine 5'-phosphate oxidase superfamily)